MHLLTGLNCDCTGSAAELRKCLHGVLRANMHIVYLTFLRFWNKKAKKSARTGQILNKIKKDDFAAIR